ncbi:MAG TPA: OmpH family outer membrane protein [Firmicutes bacterium]|nr:OmpH family outer membrane protein [Bacillota bacterium]
MKKNLFILIMLLSLLVSCVVYGAGFGSDSKFAVIDLNQIKQESLAYQRLEEDVRKLGEELEEYKGEILTVHTRKVRELTAEYEAAVAGKSGDEAERLRKDYQKKVQELAEEAQKKMDTKQRELELIQEEKNLAFNEKLDAAVLRMVNRWNLSCVLHKGGVTVGGRDITKTVMKRIDKEYKPSFWSRIFGRKSSVN